MKVDVGCGRHGTRYSDWGFTGVDVYPAVEQGLYISYNGRTLPYAENLVAEVACIHVIEHMPRPDGLHLLKEIKRILQPGCKAYVSTPDLAIMAKAYLDGDERFYKREYRPGAYVWNGPTLADKFLDSIMGMGPSGHRYAYDYTSLCTLGEEAGFIVEPTPDDCPFWKGSRRSISILCVFRKKSHE